MKEKNSQDQRLFTISIVAKMLNIHPQTLRLYEKKGLITPSRISGRNRLYSYEDIENLKTILHLTNDLGVNLAGVEVILQLKKKMLEREEKLKQEFMEFLREFMDEILSREKEADKALIRVKKTYMKKYQQTL